eukprot:scpid32497/ scgid14929/ 
MATRTGSSAAEVSGGQKYSVEQGEKKLIITETSTGDVVAEFEWPTPPQDSREDNHDGPGATSRSFPQCLAWSDWLDQTTLLVLFSRTLRGYDVISKEEVFSVPLDSYFETGVLLRDHKSVVVGTGEAVEAWDLSNLRNGGAKRLPLEYVHDEAFQPMEGVEFGFAMLPGGRLVDLEVRDGKRSFVIWSVCDQTVLDVIPFPFPDTFQPEYCNLVKAETLMIGDYAESHYAYNLQTRQWQPVNDLGEEPETEDDNGDWPDISYFWKLADLGGGYFASLPKEAFPAIVHVWDVSIGCRVANFRIGVDPADKVERESDDIVTVIAGSEKQRWSMLTSKQVD